MTDVPATPRRGMSSMRRLKVFEVAGGICHLCSQRIQAGQKWDVEHKRALALGGADDESNMVPAHKVCHAIKTRADNASWTKAKRVKAKHVGIKKPPSFRRPPGARFDWKRGRYVTDRP